MREHKRFSLVTTIALAWSASSLWFGALATAGEDGVGHSAEMTVAESASSPHGASTEELFIAIGTVWLAVATTLLWIATHKLHTGAEKASAKTATQMGEQIKAAISSNDALREVADATKNNAVLMADLMSKQFRAYVVADFGRGFYQDKSFYFGAEAVIRNRGLTPAHNVSFWLSAKVMKNEAVDLSRPVGISVAKNDATVVPTQEYVISRYVDHRFSDEEVMQIMDGTKQRLFLYGEISYDDIYAKPHVTKFCHSFFFTKELDKEGKELGYRYHSLLHPTHNTAS